MRFSGGGFGRRRAAGGPADAAGLGLGGTEHALLGAVVERPDSGGVVLTGRLSLAAQPWLADHVVGGVVLFPGAGFVELVIRAGDEVGCAVIEELVLAAPLVMHAGRAVAGAGGGRGRRRVGAAGRCRCIPGADQPDAEWLLHAEGTLGVTAAEASADLSVWPPDGAESVDISDGYARLAERGYDYGPAFQGLVAMWRRGPELFAEVAAPADAGVRVDGVGIHPALLDAVLHAVGLGRRHRRDRVAVLLAGSVAACRAAPVGCGPASPRRVTGAMSIERGRCGGPAGVDGGCAGHPPDDRRAATRRGEHGRRRARSRPLEVVWSPISLKPQRLTGRISSRWCPGRTSGADADGEQGYCRECGGVGVRVGR